MPHRTFIEMPTEEQAEMLAALRRARYGSLLPLHILLLCTAGHTPTDIAPVLFCSRSSVYRTVRPDREGSLGWEHDDDGQLIPPVHSNMRLATLQRALVALLKAPPRAFGWCRTRWSCATLAATSRPNEASPYRLRPCGAGSTRSAGCGRAPLVAKDDDPRRVARLARIRVTFE